MLSKVRNITQKTRLKVSRVGNTVFRLFSLNKRRSLLPRSDCGHVLGVRKRDASQRPEMQLVDTAVTVLPCTLERLDD